MTAQARTDFGPVEREPTFAEDADTDTYVYRYSYVSPEVDRLTTLRR
jgi:hypothetical protein